MFWSSREKLNGALTRNHYHTRQVSACILLRTPPPLSILFLDRSIPYTMSVLFWKTHCKRNLTFFMTYDASSTPWQNKSPNIPSIIHSSSSILLSSHIAILVRSSNYSVFFGYTSNHSVYFYGENSQLASEWVWLVAVISIKVKLDIESVWSCYLTVVPSKRNNEMCLLWYC